MLGHLKTAALFALFVGVTPALAQQAPWERPQPRGMTQAHAEYANQALQVMNRMGDAFNGNPGDFHRRIWTWQRGRNHVTPISNMDAPDITNLLNGRYFVYQAGSRGNVWNVRYHDPNGETHFCLGQGNGTFAEYTLDHYVHRVGFGLSGVFYWEQSSRPDLSETWAWPFVANARTGQVAAYSWEGRSWETSIGWVQAEYAAAFAEHCPRLPRVSRVNNNQTGTTIQEIARGARAITGFRTAFENDPADPLTAGMFYWAHPPE